MFFLSGKKRLQRCLTDGAVSQTNRALFFLRSFFYFVCVQSIEITLHLYGSISLASSICCIRLFSSVLFFVFVLPLSSSFICFPGWRGLVAGWVPREVRTLPRQLRGYQAMKWKETPSPPYPRKRRHSPPHPRNQYHQLTKRGHFQRASAFLKYTKFLDPRILSH